MALDLEQKKEIISKFQRKEKDTGSPEVQVALISKRIEVLTQHLKVNKKDHSSRLGLLKLVGQRKRLLEYLRKKNPERYNKIISDLEIRK